MNQLSERGNNTIFYEFYLSKVPGKDLIKEYTERLNEIIGRNDLIIFKCSKDDTSYNSCSGDIKFDSNLELEWLIIYGLVELSKMEDDLIIRIYDNDGDVILIEAADHIPEWLESKKSESRVFIHQGKVHIVPENIRLEKSGRLKTLEAANLVRRHEHPTLASPKIQSAIASQLHGMPDTKVWLERKYEFLDRIVSGKKSRESGDDIEELVQKESLTLNSIRALNKEDLRTSPISSAASSSSGDWETEEEEDQDNNFLSSSSYK